MFMEVFDSKGEMFEVRPDVARRLIIEEGWSPTRVPMKLPETPAPVEAPSAPAVEHPAEEHPHLPVNAQNQPETP